MANGKKVDPEAVWPTNDPTLKTPASTPVIHEAPQNPDYPDVRLTPDGYASYAGSGALPRTLAEEQANTLQGATGLKARILRLVASFDHMRAEMQELAGEAHLMSTPPATPAPTVDVLTTVPQTPAPTYPPTPTNDVIIPVKRVNP